MTVITKRISAAVTDRSSRRVASNGTTPDTFSDPWKGSWANSWGNSWKIVTNGLTASPAIDISKRIAGAPTGGITKRIAGV